MKVYIHYSDGHYSMSEVPEGHDNVMATAEITDEQWNAYEAHMIATRGWYDFLQALEASPDYQRQQKEGWAKYHEAHKPKGD